MGFLLASIIVVTWGSIGFAIALVVGTEAAPFFGVANMEGYPAMLAFVWVAPAAPSPEFSPACGWCDATGATSASSQS